MIRRISALAVLGIAALALATAATARPDVGADRYIVVLKDGADSGAVAAEHARTHAAAVAFVYSHALNGYAATIPNARIDEVRADSRVAYVEADGEMCRRRRRRLPWGIDTG